MPTVVLALIMATFTGVMIVGPSLAMNGFLYNPLFFGFVTGLVIGDVRSGFSIGATCMLMSLGFYTYGAPPSPITMSARFTAPSWPPAAPTWILLWSWPLLWPC